MSPIIEFALAYRKLDRPTSWKGSSLSFSSFTYSLAISEVIESFRLSKTGQFAELVIDGYEVNPSAFDAAVNWKTLHFTFTLDTSGAVPIFRNFKELMDRSKSFVRKPLPAHFYLFEEDILSSEEPADDRVKSLQIICNLIVYLADLAHYHDEKGSDEYKLVFMAEDIAKGERAITLQPYLDQELLSYEVHTDLLNSLQGDNLDINTHLSKERSIFRASLIEYLSSISGSKERFKALISTWNQFRALYENNLSTYLSGFSFHKAKQEVAIAQLSIADQMSKVVSDMSGKILSVPISLIAVIAIFKTEDIAERTILVLGITLTSALLAETLAAQKLQYERIKHSRMIMFATHDQKAQRYPPDLRNFLQEAIKGLSSNEAKLRRSLRTLRTICWIPTLAAIFLHGYLYKVELKTSLTMIYETIKTALK